MPGGPGGDDGASVAGGPVAAIAIARQDLGRSAANAAVSAQHDASGGIPSGAKVA